MKPPPPPTPPPRLGKIKVKARKSVSRNCTKTQQLGYSIDFCPNLSLLQTVGVSAGWIRLHSQEHPQCPTPSPPAPSRPQSCPSGMNPVPSDSFAPHFTEKFKALLHKSSVLLSSPCQYAVSSTLQLFSFSYTKRDVIPPFSKANVSCLLKSP